MSQIARRRQPPCRHSDSPVEGKAFLVENGDIISTRRITLTLTSQIWKTRSCAGISGKSQILFLVVFVTRYLDLVTNFVSVYNTVMKVLCFIFIS